MSFKLGEITKALLVDPDGHPYEIGGATDSTVTIDLPECKKALLHDLSGNPYQM